MGTKRQTPTRDAWAERVEHWGQSGLDAATFAAKAGEPVTAVRLKRWKWKLNQLAKQAQNGASVAMSFVRLEATKAVTQREPVEIVIDNGRLVRVGVGFDEDTLARVLAVIEGGKR